MLALFPFIVMFLVTSITTLRERRTGTLERLLRCRWAGRTSSSATRSPSALLAIVQTLIAVAYAVWVCGLDIKGNIWLLVAVALADAILGTTLGLFVSAFARTEFQVVQFMPALIFPQILLGGIFIPRDQLPDALHIISDWLPLSHAIDALNAVANDTHDAAYVGGQLLIIGAFAVAAIIGRLAHAAAPHRVAGVARRRERRCGVDFSKCPTLEKSTPRSFH